MFVFTTALFWKGNPKGQVVVAFEVQSCWSIDSIQYVDNLLGYPSVDIGRMVCTETVAIYLPT